MKFFPKKCFLFFLAFSFPAILFGIDIGSDTAVTRFETQVTLNDGDRVAGFAALEEGFQLADSTVIATWDSFFNVSGDVDLSHGILVLHRDFMFSDTAEIVELGDIVGNDHTVEFSSSISYLPGTGSGCVTFSDVNVFLNQDIFLEQECFYFSGESMISGRGNTLTLDPTCTVYIDSGSSLLLKDIEIQGINGYNIQCTDASSTISFHDVEWVQDGDFTFTVGKFEVLNEFIITGDEFVFAYQTDQVSTVSTYGRIVIDNGMTFSYDPPTASRELLNLYADTSEFVLYGGTLHATSTGTILDTGRLIFDRNSSLVSEGTVEDEAILLTSELDIQWLPGAYLNCSGYVVIE